MSSKLQAANKAIAVKSKRESTDSSKRALQPDNKQRLPAKTPEGVLVFDNCSTTVEVTVKTKGRKRTSTMVSGTPSSQKALDEKKRPSSGGDNQHTWSRILREQNRLAMKQSLQQHVTKMHSTKSARQSSTDSKDTRKGPESLNAQKYDNTHVNKHLDEVPVKQAATSRKLEEKLRMASSSAIPSTTSIASSMESIVVVDKAVQCGGIFDCANDSFGVFNPVRTLGFLMKELEGLVRDERSSKILSDMEQALLRIPCEPGKTTPEDLEAIALRIQLEAGTAKLEDMSRKMDATCGSLREQRDNLQQQVQKQAKLLEEARQREADLEMKLRNKVDEMTRTLMANQKTISELKEDNKRMEKLQKMNNDLRSELNSQMELAQQRFMEGQYLKLEKEKLLVLSSYKDTQLVELRTAVKELQNHITEQLVGLREAYKCDEDSTSHLHVSVVHGGLACSSPTQTSSEHTNIPPSWHGLSEISLSTVEPNTYRAASTKKSPTSIVRNVSYVEGMAGDNDRRRSNDVNAQLEFISLPGGETSHTMSMSNFRDKESKHADRSGTGDDVQLLRDNTNKNHYNTVPAPSEPKNPVYEMDSQLLSDKKDSDKTTVKSIYKAKRSSDSDKRARPNKNRSTLRSTAEESLKIVRDHSMANPIDVSIKEQFQNIFKDIRQQSRVPVHIPSPPRHYPHPDWSDSSLPSISGISESNVV